MLLFALAALSGCAPGGKRVVIASTTDLMGKTSPCGCHTPKGGLARRAALLDSLRGRRGELLVLDAGGAFPHADDEREAAPFMLAEFARTGTAAAAVGPSELRFGYSFAREHARAAGVTLLCANLVRFDTGLPAFEAGRVFRVSGVRVGVFGILKETADMGPARDSLRVDPALPAARRMVDELRSQGAQVVVALAQLGSARAESLATQVPGLDLVLSGGGVPVDRRARAFGGVPVLHAGSQGWQVGVTEVRLDAQGAVQAVDARTIELGPAVRTEPATAARVKTFEDSLNAHQRVRRASLGMAALDRSAPHFSGQAACVECHASQYAQWQATAHARAWKTLVDLQKESTSRCVPCHVTGHGEPGGFRTADDAARSANVQCEACHGMGSSHRQWTEDGSHVAEAVCRSCHNAETSPTFSFAAYRPHVLHDPPPGLQPLPESPAKRLMRSDSHNLPH